MPLSRYTRVTPRSTAESGFTIVELMVVLLIAAILMGISMYGVRSARKSGRHVAAVSTAQAYADAADRFAREHDGRYPAAPGGTVDWDGGANAQRGPKSDSLGTIRYYLRDVPEEVQDGRITIQQPGPASIQYQQTGGGTGFIMTVTIQDSTPCVVLGGAATSSVRACSRR